ncbi:MAG: hypothetical protein NTV79_02130 [Candidatus Aureabacteria bacterium]|nr:hypothetical protein [Candidatus Auribacterota bacterium]
MKPKSGGTGEPTVICTICCRKKDPAAGLLPALRRYRSNRIDRAAELARSARMHLVILSGKFGPRWADAPIPDYDRLLLPRDVPRVRRLIASFLQDNGIGSVNYLLPDPALGSGHYAADTIIISGP